MPTFLIKLHLKAIRSWSFVIWHSKNGSLHLLFRDTLIQLLKVTVGGRNASPIDVNAVRRALLSNAFKMMVYDLLLQIVFRNPTIVMLETMDKILPPSMVNTKVKVAGVSIAVLQIGDS